MTEFALVLPVLAIILIGILQFGVAFKQYLTLTDAVREGARKAAVSRHLSDPGGYVEQEVVEAASDLGSEFTTEDVDVTSPWTPGSDVVVKAWFPFKISIFGVGVTSGTMSSTATERVE